MASPTTEAYIYNRSILSLSISLFLIYAMMDDDDDASNTKDSPFSETKKIVNHRVEIDTTAQFESVKEAVDRFGGSGPWIPIHLLRLASRQHEHEGFDVSKIEEQAAELEKDLITKEHQTLNVLKQLEAAKKSVEDLKMNFVPEVPPFIASPLHCGENSKNLCSSTSPGFVFMELDRAKSNLRKASIDLACIQESIESLNMVMQRGKDLLERRGDLQEEMNRYTNTGAVLSPCDVSATMSSFEAEQFNKMTEASRYEVVRAMTEIERTKNSIKMAELRLIAAKKMEEAAKAMEAIAVAKALLHDEDRMPDSYNTRAQESCKKKLIFSDTFHRINEASDHVEAFKGIIKEEHTRPSETNNMSQEESHRHQENCDNSSVNFGLESSHTDSIEGNDRSETGLVRSTTTTSIGDILSRKLVAQDGVGRVENQRRRVSLSDMLKEQSRVILHHPSLTSRRDDHHESTAVEKLRFVHRKKFGFIQVPLLSRQSKKQSSTTLNI